MGPEQNLGTVMARVFKWLGLIVLVLLGAAAAIYFTGNTFNAIVWLAKPTHGWDLARNAPAPDYAQEEAWAARPGVESFASFAPAGVANISEERMVDVFFVHPTGYLSNREWNSPLNPVSRTEENTKWMMANQASAFNSCCNVYAPRYREASIYRYLTAAPEVARNAMDLAYSDIVRAFDHFLEHDNKGRPFIIASHSQGTEHAFRLVRERIDETVLAKRMVAGYLIGLDLTPADADKLRTVRVCDSESDTGCIVHWAAWGAGGNPPPDQLNKLLCVNPLTWKRDGGRAEASLHKGGVAMSGRFSLKLWGDDAAQGVAFEPLKAPIPRHTWAECKDGLLIVADQAGGPFAWGDMGGKNYHGLDYPLFHMDIRENARVRTAAYLQAAVEAAGPPTGAATTAPVPY
jgi:hypothetical protein